MIILGIDPGTTAVGYAFLEAVPTPRILQADLIPIRGKTITDRLIELHRGISRTIQKRNPSRVAVERLFFTKNQKTAFAVAEARGVILLTTALAGLSLYEYTPLEVKQTVTGDGKADKIQMKKMIHLTFPETKTLRAPDDVFDAIGIALTCCLRERHPSS